MRSHPAFKAAVVSASTFDRKSMSGLLTVALLHYMAHLMERGWKSKRAYAWPDRRFKRGKGVA